MGMDTWQNQLSSQILCDSNECAFDIDTPKKSIGMKYIKQLDNNEHVPIS